MQQLDLVLSQLDLRTLHLVLCLGGVLLATHLMQLVWHNPDEGGLILRWARRINLAFMALAMLWSIGIVDQRGWQPWPAFVLLLASADFMMLIRIWVIYRTRNRPARSQGVVHIRRVS